MSRSQTTFQKRQRELQKIRRREAKAAKAAQRRAHQDAERDAIASDGVDPDLAGIVAGPHNNQPDTDDMEIEMDGVGGVILRPKRKPAAPSPGGPGPGQGQGQGQGQ